MPLPGGAGATGSSLPANWRTQPTTQASFDAAVAVIQQTYGQDIAQGFQAWYAQAWARDPRLTPRDAIIVYVTQQALGPGIAATGTLVGAGVPSAAAAAAEKAAAPFSGLSSAWDAATAIPRFLSMLTSPHLWLRIGEAVAGLILLGIGLNAMLKGKPMTVVTGAAGKLGRAVM